MNQDEAAKPATPLIVFTDLDGTLLDARTYSVGSARTALDLLAARGVPVVFCSSKTAAEQRPLRHELGLDHTPFIVENGAAVLVPESAGLPVASWPRSSSAPTERMHVLGRAFTEVKDGIRRASVATGISVTGYAELTVPAIAQLTGLDEAAATRARQREFSETLVDTLSPETWCLLDTALATEGLRCRHGGRFHTVTGAETDKGRAVRLVTELFHSARGRPISTVGLGDSENDEGMLFSVDRAFLLPKREHHWATMEIPGLHRLAYPSPRGWHDAIVQLLASL